jgi:hypothetical protein
MESEYRGPAKTSLLSVGVNSSSIVWPYFEALVVYLGNSESGLAILKDELRSGQFKDVVKLSTEIDRVHREICLALKAFAPRPEGSSSDVLTIEQIILALKLYLISWATLLDMVASLLNKILDLGIADRDITFERIVKHELVMNSELSAIIERYDEIELREFKNHRNEIVHRGRILDKEIEATDNNRSLLDSRRYPILVSEARISEEDYKKECAEQTKQLVELAWQKREFYQGHYSSTFLMVEGLLIELAKKTAALYKIEST